MKKATTTKKEKKVTISRRDREAIAEFKRRVREVFPEAEIILFGSVARGEKHRYSDIDLLVILDREINPAIKKEIYDLAYDLDLEHEVLLAPFVKSRHFWESDRANTMPLKWNVDREGIKI
jgi:predicted nucleotidyltransferase